MYKIFVIFLLFSHVFAVAEKGSDNTALVLSFPLSKETGLSVVPNEKIIE